MSEDKSPERLARTLEVLVEQGLVPGLLPEDVKQAAATLRGQAAELVELRKALAAKHHTVEIKVSEAQPYRKKVEATFIIADPRVYHAEMVVDDMHLEMARFDVSEHIGRQLVRAGTSEWFKELEQQAIVAIHRALPTQPIETRSDKTAQRA